MDYDLHGFVGIRLLDATPADVAAVARQLGPIDRPLARAPDITIRFVDCLPIGSDLCFLGLEDVAFTRDAFLCLRSKHKARARVQIPFAQVGGRCEILCEHGLPAVPFLVAIVNLTALGHGVLALHASAFNYEGVGVLVTGWAKGGKTESLLAFMAHGAQYVGDEWVYLTADGQAMYGLPEPIRVWSWHLQSLPAYRAALAGRDRARLGVLDPVVHVLAELAADGPRSRALATPLHTLLARHASVSIPPQRLFGPDRCVLAGVPEKVFLVASHAAPEVEVAPVDPGEIARRMAFSLQEEQRDFFSCYRKFRFAFPRVQNRLLEESESRQFELLTHVLRGKEAHVVYHPYPVALEALFEHMRPYCAAGVPV